jgi:hypothetical protein
VPIDDIHVSLDFLVKGRKMLLLNLSKFVMYVEQFDGCGILKMI